jgi:acetyl esterase/lipase
VTASTPRTFLVAADDDPTVNAAENAGRFFAALRAAKVPAELSSILPAATVLAS